MSDDPQPHLHNHLFQLSSHDLAFLNDLLTNTLPDFSIFLQAKALGISTKNSGNHEVFYEDRMTPYLNRYSKLPPASTTICKEVTSNPLLLALAESGGFDERVIETFISLQNQCLKTAKDGKMDFVEDSYLEPCSYWVLEEDTTSSSVSSGIIEANSHPMKVIFQNWHRIVEYLKPNGKEFNKLKFEENISPLYPEKARPLSSFLLSSKEKPRDLREDKSCVFYRPHSDIEEEEKFLEEHGHLFPEFQPLHSWRELFPYYNENLDAPDASWLLHSLEKRKRSEEKQSARKKQKTGNHNIPIDPTRDPLFLDLPIAVSCVHPASVTNSSKSRPLLSEALSFSEIHPAFVQCNEVLPPPGKMHTRSLNLVDLALDTLEHTICDVEGRNFAQLCQVLSRARREQSISEKCRKKLAVLDDLLFRTYRHNEPKQSGRVIYTKSSGSFANRSPRDANRSRMLTRNQSVDTTRLGACDPCHVPAAHFVSTLQVGDAVNVKQGGIWRRGLVLALKRDREMIRLLKVKVLEVNIVRWIAVESGLLAQVNKRQDTSAIVPDTNGHNRSETPQEQQPCPANAADERTSVSQCQKPSEERLVSQALQNAAPSVSSFPSTSCALPPVLAAPTPAVITPLFIPNTPSLQQFYSPLTCDESFRPSIVAPVNQEPANAVDPRVFVTPSNPRIYALVANNHRQIVTHAQSLLVPPPPAAPVPVNSGIHRPIGIAALPVFSPPGPPAFQFLPVGFPQVQVRPPAPYLPYPSSVPAPRIFSETFRLLPGGNVKKNH